ncbi:hypothetical protein Tco_0856507 [Tanacetum coccineum]|uniref:Uncharacterized protein n=1 Tax=Tanacetum coccineum TaxID=301880 RepID=A0ABQ5B3J7_9ASTR
MASFKVLETQFQMFIKSRMYMDDEYVVMTRNYFLQYTQLAIPEFCDTLIQHMESVKKSIDEKALHKREYDIRVNERQIQTKEGKVDTGKAVDANLVNTESNGTKSKEQDTSSISGNDAHADDLVFDTRKSTSGGIQFLGDKLVSWMSKKQDCTAMSSAKAKYVALSASCAQVENGIIELYFVRTEYQLADMFTKALPEDRFQYLVRHIGMRCLTPAELEGRMPTKIELTLEQSQQGVSNDVLSPTHYPCDSARTFRVILFSIHNDEWKSFQCHHQTALRSYALRWKPCQGDSLNLPGHRIHKDGDGDASFQLKLDSLPHAHAQTTKTFYKHQDSRIMKAQELKDKDFRTNSDIQDLPSKISRLPTESVKKSIDERAQRQQEYDSRMNDRQMHSKEKKKLQIQEVQSNTIHELKVDSVVMENTCSGKEKHQDLKGTRIEHGFKRTFMSLFGQDADTFTSTMLLNVDQLQKQLDKEEKSMAAFWVRNADLNAQIQEKVFANAALKNELRKLKGNSMDTKISRPWFASKVDEKNDLSKTVIPHYLPKVRESAPSKPHHVNALALLGIVKKEIFRTRASTFDSWIHQFRTRANPVSLTPYVSPSKKDYEIMFQPLFDEYFSPPPRVVSLNLVVVTAPRAVDPVSSPSSTTIDQDVPSANLSSEETTLQGVIPSNLHHLNQSFDTLTKLIKNHPLENVIGDPSRSVLTRSQLQEHAIWCYFDANDNPIPFGGKRSG